MSPGVRTRRLLHADRDRAGLRRSTPTSMKRPVEICSRIAGGIEIAPRPAAYRRCVGHHTKVGGFVAALTRRGRERAPCAVAPSPDLRTHQGTVREVQPTRRSPSARGASTCQGTPSAEAAVSEAGDRLVDLDLERACRHRSGARHRKRGRCPRHRRRHCRDRRRSVPRRCARATRIPRVQCSRNRIREKRHRR